MSKARHPFDSAEAARELVRLKEEISQAHLELASLRPELALARMPSGASKAARLVEANEHLVLAALAAQRAAEASAQALAAMVEAAEVDPLTGLPTSAVLRARLASALAAGAQGRGRVALTLLNLPDFKLISDTLGNAVGDEVLQMAARRLVASAGPDATVCRHRGHEFLVLLPHLADGAEAVNRSAAMVAALGAPTVLHRQVLRLSANVGISIHPEDGADPETLIGQAVADMHSAGWRGLGRNAFVSEPARAEQSPELRALDSMRHPVQLPGAPSAGDSLLLREANTQLLLAAISAQEQQDAAEQAQRRQSTFLGVLAHELRNPLTPISNAASILGRIPSEGPMLPKVQQIIERQVKIMARLVEDLFDLIRVNAGKLRLEKEWVDMRSLVDQVAQTSRPAMEARMQRFEVELPPPGVTLHGDPVRLTQVLVNLLGNAAKYTPERGEIRLCAEVAGDTLVLKVTDNGIGIRPQALASIFDPFSQEHHATLFNGEGLGIGLAVVRELVQGHGGSVSATSAGIGLGSQFTVILPLGRAAGGPG